MIPADRWLGENTDDGAISGHRVLDWICVPLIVTGLVGLLWSLPVPAALRAASPALNWGTLFLMAAVVYYFVVSISLALGALPFIVAVVAVVAWLDTLDVSLSAVCGPVFFLAWITQLFGRRAVGKAPRPMTNLQHVMLAPLRLLASVYRRLQVPF